MDEDKEYTVSEAADKILEHLIKCQRPCDEFRIQAEIFPDIHLDEIRHVLNYMRDFPTTAEVVKEYDYNDGGLKATKLAESLLNQGGYTALQKQIDEQKEKQKKVLDKQLQLSDLQISTLVDKIVENPKISARAKRLEFWTVISIILAIIAIIVSIAKKW